MLVYNQGYVYSYLFTQEGFTWTFVWRQLGWQPSTTHKSTSISFTVQRDEQVMSNNHTMVISSFVSRFYFQAKRMSNKILDKSCGKLEDEEVVNRSRARVPVNDKGKDHSEDEEAAEQRRCWRLLMSVEAIWSCPHMFLESYCCGVSVVLQTP